MEFSEPVKVTGNIRLRLDLGKDDTVLNNSQKGLTDYSVLHGGQTLRFKYTVGNSNDCSLTTQHGDCDPDGLWVQTRSSDNRVLFPGTANIVHAVTGEEADLTYAHLPTSGDPLHKVDGSKTNADVGPLPSGATVNGATLKLVFAAGLAPPSDLDALRFDFQVRGAGGIGADNKADSQSPTAIVHRAVSKGDSFGGLELTLGAPARAGDIVTVSYTGTTLKGPGASGKRAPMFRGLAVTNNTQGTKGPALLYASVTGTKLRLVFGDDLDTGSLPAGSAFTVEARDPDDDERNIAGTGTVSITDHTGTVSMTGNRVVTVTLASALRADENAAVSYEKPSSMPLRSAASGNAEVQSFDRFKISAADDGVAPKLRGGVAVQTGTSPARSKLVLYFDEALDTSSVPAAGNFAVRTDGTVVTVSAVAVEDRSVVLTLARLAVSGTTAFEVTYTPGTRRIRDWAGNEAAGFRQTVSAAATGKPVLQSAQAEGAKVVLTYDKALDPASVPENSAFADAFIFHLTLTGSQTIDGTTQANSPDTLGITVTGIEVSGKTAVLHLKHPILPCVPAFELTYKKPSASPLQGLDGTEADAFANQAVVNARAYRCNNSNWMEGARVGSIILRAKQPFATDVTPEASWFTVKAASGPVTVTAAAYSEDDAQELKLTLSRDLVPGEDATVSYRRPEGALGLWDTDGNQLGDIEDQEVSNPASGALPAPDVPTLTNASGTSVTVRWTAPDTTGPEAITGYDVHYRRHGATDWTDHGHEGVETSTTISGLAAGARWEARVRAINADGLGNWSEAGTGHTGPARLESVAMPAHGRGLVLTFTKDIHVSGVHTAYTVMVDGARRATSHASWDGATVSLVLAEPVSSGESVTVAYAQPTGRTMLHDVDNLAVADFGPHAVANTVARAANTAATGAPTISGTARVGETLTASTSGISDANGLSGASYSYQWVSGDGDIAGATSQSYTLAEADAGKRIKVRVAFTDDAGNRETLMSAATGAVAPLLPPLTASFHGMPAEHDGRKLFSFELRFSEDFPGRLDYKVLRDSAFQVGNGRVRVAKRVAQGQNQRWTISVRPSSHEAVTVTLPAGSVVTEAGRELAEAVTATVRGPALLSVADARGREEAADGAAEFAVSLSRAASGEVTVDYVTRDGTAKAGEDYTQTRGTLTFAVGETQKTVSVPILDDSHDEGEETFTLKLLNPKGAWIADDEATGTIVNSDPIPKAWLARFGRTVTGQVLDAVEARFSALRAAGAGMELAGQALPLWKPGSDPSAAEGSWEDVDWFGDSREPDVKFLALTRHTLLTGTSFAATAGSGDPGGGFASLWGRGAISSFDGREGDLTLDGEVTTGLIGADWSSGAGSLTAGLAVGRSTGTGGYRAGGCAEGSCGGSIEATLNGFYPYAGAELTDRLSVWLAGGYGMGEVRVRPDGVAPFATDLTMGMVAAGLRGEVAKPADTGGFGLALKGDGRFTRTESDAARSADGGRLAEAEADVWMLRTGIEASRRFGFDDASVTPSFEIGARLDGGDAETGFGADMGGGLVFADPANGLTLDMKARALVAHRGVGFPGVGRERVLRLGSAAR